jgi:hypothetical protein
MNNRGDQRFQRAIFLRTRDGVKAFSAAQMDDPFHLGSGKLLHRLLILNFPVSNSTRFYFDRFLNRPWGSDLHQRNLDEECPT